MSPTYTVVADEPTLEERLGYEPGLMTRIRKLQEDMRGHQPSDVAAAMVEVIREAGCESKLL